MSERPEAKTEGGLRLPRSKGSGTSICLTTLEDASPPCRKNVNNSVS